MLMLAGLVLIVSLMSSTKESRAAASRKLARWNPLLWCILVALWAPFLLFEIWPSGW